MAKVCFDYGHGGRDPGVVYKGRREPVDNLDLGMRVTDQVAIYGLKVGETRTSDVDLTLREKVNFANKGNHR